MEQTGISVECAPMEGVTNFAFRRAQAAVFGGCCRYYTPFISPTYVHSFTNRDLRELLPEHNEKLPVIPQLIGHNAEDILWAIRALQDMGYPEVNLNLGCPSGTVVSKKKGAGLLGYPDLLKELLDAVYDRSPLPVSIKTRTGVKSSEGFPALLELYNQYPVRELILHPRYQAQQYKGTADREMWRFAVRNSRLPLCYNGDLFHRGYAARFLEEFPAAERIMVGRGLIANPKLAAEIAGASPITLPEFEEFHLRLMEENKACCLQERQLVLHMKEFWYYAGRSFENAERAVRNICKCDTRAEYDRTVEVLLKEHPLKKEAGYYL